MTIAPYPSGSAPETDLEVVFLSALSQAPAGHVIDLCSQLNQHDFTPAGTVIVQAVLDHAHDVAASDRNAYLALPVIHNNLSASGSFQLHDDGVRHLMSEMATTPADPLHIAQLIQALKLRSWRRALTTFQSAVASIDAKNIGVDQAHQLINHATQHLTESQSRLATTPPNNRTGGKLHAV